MMQSIATTLGQRFQYVKSIYGMKDFTCDSRTSGWLLMCGEPTCILAVTVAYLLLVWAGNRYMSSRAPVSVSRTLLATYNLALVVLSAYMAIETGLAAYDLNYDVRCAAYTEHTWRDARELRMASVLHLFFLSKLPELMDTAFMVLRKKQRQITFLHLYHHASIPNIWWMVVMFSPGGQVWLPAFLNSTVHVVMYTYYGLSLFPSLYPHLWWKKYITTMQMVQFVLMLCHHLYGLATACPFPPAISLIYVTYASSLLILFLNFYIHAYSKTTHETGSGLAGQTYNSSPKSNDVQTTNTIINKKFD